MPLVVILFRQSEVDVYAVSKIYLVQEFNIGLDFLFVDFVTGPIRQSKNHFVEFFL